MKIESLFQFELMEIEQTREYNRSVIIIDFLRSSFLNIMDKEKLVIVL